MSVAQLKLETQRSLRRRHWLQEESVLSALHPYLDLPSNSAVVLESSTDSIGCHYLWNNRDSLLSMESLDQEVHSSPVIQKTLLQVFQEESILYRFDAIKLKTMMGLFTGCLVISSSTLSFFSTVDCFYILPLRSLYTTFYRSFYGYNRGLEVFFRNGVQLFFVFHDKEERGAVSSLQMTYL